jgi:hypothetical protein
MDTRPTRRPVENIDGETPLQRAWLSLGRLNAGLA